MVCGQCGTVAEPTARRCVKCDSDFSAVTGAVVTADSDFLTAPGSVGTSSRSDFHPDSFQPGQKFGTRYTILKKLGAGGMGAVYQAFDDSLGVAVALKVIRLDASTSSEETRQLEARFKRELLLARQVTHPNVVRIHDLGELGTTKYLTMAYVEGADLSTVMRREGKLPVERALAIMKQVAEGLSAAHNAGVVHRDLKPANVMIDGEGRALLTDFGIARSVDAATLHTVPGSIVGTLDYMAPEQARGETVDRRSDVYSLGLIFYEMLAGGRPRPAGGGGLADLLARVETGPPPIGSVAPDVPPPLQQIVTRSLERRPDARYGSAGEFLADLNRLAPDGRVLPTVVLPAPVGPARSKGLVFGLAALIVMLLGGAGLWMLRGRTPAAPTTPREPVSVLIADFENRAADPLFTGTLEQALEIGMEGASFVATYPRGEALKVAQTIKAGPALDAAAAQLVALRQEVPVVLAGSVEQESTGYKLKVSALRPGTDRPFATVEERATDKAGVLRAIDRIATELRKALGDRPVEGVSQAENVSAASLDALREYTIAQALSMDRRNEEAITHYRAATDKDPQFGRAYAGWALAAFDAGRHDDAAELWKKALAHADRMTEREQYRTLGGYYLSVARNYEKAIENYTLLVDKYPADLAGQNNLAIAYFYTRNFEKAFEYGKRAIDTYPHSLKFRNNYALYAMYAGQFKTAAENAETVLKQDPKYAGAYLPLAIAALSDGDVARAREIYGKARDSGSMGASLAGIGLADIALYEGKASDAVAVVEPAIAVDRAARNTFGVATKVVTLTEAQTALSGATTALALLAPLVADSSDESIVVPAARLFGAAKQDARAQQLAQKLEDRGQPVPRAYADIITGEIALQQRRYADAISSFSSAIKDADLWLARFDLGVAYVEANRHAEALGEFNTCDKRRGEATALFFDDIPTFRYTAVLPYWRGRAQEGLGQTAAAATSYEQFLKIRSSATNDALVDDAKKRLQALAGASSR